MLQDPRLMNYILLVLYLINATRWAWYGSWADTLYWLSALGLTIALTFGYKH